MITVTVKDSILDNAVFKEHALKLGSEDMAVEFLLIYAMDYISRDKWRKLRMTPLDLMGLWNEHCGALPKIKEMSNTRRAKVISRLRECDDEAQWTAAIKYYARSEWHNGSNDRNWKADFTFLIRPDTRIKALEAIENGSKSTARLEDW